MKPVCKRIFIAVICSFLFLLNALAQPKCKVDFYSTEQGLSHQAVTCIVKDSEGFMWFGSWDGINRFDGHSFVSFKSSPGDMSVLENDRIDEIVEDQEGQLWIIAYDKQVYLFDKRTRQFRSLSKFIDSGSNKKTFFYKILAASNGKVWLQSETDGLFCLSQKTPAQNSFTRFNKSGGKDQYLPSNVINFWHQDSQNRVWVGTPAGLCCFVQSPGSNYVNSSIVPAQIAGNTNCTTVDEDSDHVFFGTADGNFILFDKNKNTFSSYKISNSNINALLRSKKRTAVYITTADGILASFDITKRNITATSQQSAGALYTVYEDRQGFLWIEPENTGVVRYDPVSKTSRHFFESNAKHYNVIGNRYKVLEDKNGMVWINMKGGGFGYYDSKENSIKKTVNTSDGSVYQLPSIIYAIFFDEAGILWFTTNERQLVKLILQGNSFKQQLLEENEVSRADNEVRGIYYDRQGRVWAGAKSGRLYIYQNEKEIKDLFSNEPANGFGYVYSILQDSKNNIWIGTKGNGLFKATPTDVTQSKYRLTHYQTDRNKKFGLGCREIYSLLEDKQGRICIGSFDEGLLLVQDGKDSVKFIHRNDAYFKYPKENFNKIRHMALDGKGNLWIGTTSGLLIMDANDPGKYVTCSKIPGDKESLGNNDIQFVYRDSKNQMWLATSGGGICLAKNNDIDNSLKFRNYTTRDGLSNDYVLSCAEDRKGNLWITTESGLSEFKPGTGVFKNYDSYEGLPRASFSEAAVSTPLPNGQLVFGTTKGLLSFDPASMSTDRIAANIVFTNIQVNNEDAGPGMNETVLQNDINYVPELTLKHNQNIISIDYSILDYRAGSRSGYAYRLAGFDDKWHDDRNQRRATYTNLPPGHYIFEVKSLNSELYTNIPSRRLSFTILPPPWRTWWAYLIYAVVAIALLLIIWRTALAMIRLRNKIAVEQKLAALKLQFFTNVSHELRTPLTLILNPLEQIAKKEKLSAEGTAYAEIVRKNANRMVRFINQLLDLRKVESNKATLNASRVEIISFVKKISDYFTEAIRSKRIKLDIISNENSLAAWVDADKLDVIIYNLLGNAIKFTPEGKAVKIIISALPGEESFSIAVADEGLGVQKEKLNNIFELFYEGDHPSAREVKGTGIGLALCKEFVNLHGGNIWAENNAAGGLTVTFKLKTGTKNAGEHTPVVAEAPAGLPTAKPVEQQILPQSIFTHTEKGPEAPLVLLVEDNDELRLFLTGQLGEFYRVETAKDGEEGYRKAVSQEPDLIVSDIMMPVMDGIQLLDKVKHDINTSHIPVVLLSAKYSIESQIEGLKYGADYYITKPFNNEFLIASIDNLLRQRKNLFDSLVQKKQQVELSPGTVVVTSGDETFLKDVIRAVEEKMTDPDFNIETIAETMLMSRTTFYKKFKSLTGLTPVEFVKDMRLQRAKQYLDGGQNNISEAAYLSGFNNPKYFSTCFKEKYHVSPSEYLRLKTG
ncbi:MAG: two-component regulator propeller domain-containing protein [Ferruginibacter sp.]